MLDTQNKSTTRTASEIGFQTLLFFMDGLLIREIHKSFIVTHKLSL
jgi:hypothetical protein